MLKIRSYLRYSVFLILVFAAGFLFMASDPSSAWGQGRPDVAPANSREVATQLHTDFAEGDHNHNYADVRNGYSTINGVRTPVTFVSCYRVFGQPIGSADGLMTMGVKTQRYVIPSCGDCQNHTTQIFQRLTRDDTVRNQWCPATGAIPEDNQARRNNLARLMAEASGHPGGWPSMLPTDCSHLSYSKEIPAAFCRANDRFATRFLHGSEAGSQDYRPAWAQIQSWFKEKTTVPGEEGQSISLQFCRHTLGIHEVSSDRCTASEGEPAAEPAPAAAEPAAQTHLAPVSTRVSASR